jgi:hypothetical protein
MLKKITIQIIINIVIIGTRKMLGEYDRHEV